MKSNLHIVKKNPNVSADILMKEKEKEKVIKKKKMKLSKKFMNLKFQEKLEI